MIQLLLIAVLLLLAFYGVHSLLQAPPVILRRDMRVLALWAGLGLLLFLVATGRLGWLAALIGALIAAFSRLLPLLVQLLPVFLRARRAGAQQENQGGSRDRGTSANPKMRREEALEILGLRPEASRQQIIDAHRRLMQKIHPDRGGSAYLAAQLNKARDILLEN